MTQTIEQLQAKVAELGAEVERLKRTNSSYASLTKAQESQLTNLRQRLYQLKGADSAIDSERQANCELTEQLAAKQEEIEHLKQVQECHAIDLRERDASIKSHAEKNRELKAQLATAEQRVAEAISQLCYGGNGMRIRRQIAEGEYRKFMKGE